MIINEQTNELISHYFVKEQKKDEEAKELKSLDKILDKLYKLR